MVSRVKDDHDYKAISFPFCAHDDDDDDDDDDNNNYHHYSADRKSTCQKTYVKRS